MAETDDPKDTVTMDAVEPTHEVSEAPAATAAPVVVQRRNGVPALVGGALAAVLGFGAAQFVPDGWPLPATETLAADVATIKGDIANLQTALAALPPSDLTLQDRVLALESAPSPNLQPLEDRLAAIEAQPPQTVDTPGDGVNVATSVLAAQARDIAALQADVAALKAGGAASPEIEARLAEAEDRAAALISQTEAEAAALAQRSALIRLDIALESGTPFASALADLDGTTVPDVLTVNADQGLPTLSVLQDAFADAAREALDASLRVSAGDGWTNRAASFLRSQTGFRSLTPREGSDPDAILSRAEAAISASDIPTALTEISALPAEGQAAMADWVTKATTFIAAQQAVADLRAAVNAD